MEKELITSNTGAATCHKIRDGFLVLLQPEKIVYFEDYVPNLEVE